MINKKAVLVHRIRHKTKAVYPCYWLQSFD